MLGIMLESDLFNNNYDEIIDEVITMFFAGMKTIQTSTTNLIYNMAKNP